MTGKTTAPVPLEVAVQDAAGALAALAAGADRVALATLRALGPAPEPYPVAAPSGAEP